MTPRILFIDDDVGVLNGLRRAFRSQSEKWEVSFADSPEKAIAMVKLCPYDVIVSDIVMPRMGGIQLIQVMRELMPDSVYIILTGAADLRCAIDSINTAGVFRFFTKPCPTFLMKEGITAALGVRKDGGTGAEPMAMPTSVGEAALDLLSVGVLVVDAQARVRFVNRRGGELCAAADGLVIGAKGVCRAGAPGETTHLHRCIRSAITNGECGAVRITRPSLKRPLSVVVSPLPDSTSDPIKIMVAALYVCDPEHISLPTPEKLAMLLDLSPTQGRLAYFLSLGHSLEDVAVILGITSNTVRSYLKEIFGRTGTTRQGELIKLVLSQPLIEL